MIFVDTNILLDVLQNDAQWADWSIDRLTVAREEGDLIINAIVIAELSRDYADLGTLRSALAPFELTVESIGDDAAFVAGHRFVAARSQHKGAAVQRPLPDFFIGAHALVSKAALMTRDAKIYRRHFPELTLITPEGPSDD